MNFVQSAITSIGFPNTLESVQDIGDWTDIDLLVDFEVMSSVTWTAPRWMMQGDNLFFYHTKSAKQRITKLRKAASDINDERSGRSSRQNRLVSVLSVQRSEHIETIRLLEQATKQAESYSGTIFGCAKLSSSAEYFEPEGDKHFSSKSFAPLDKVHIFQHPLPENKFADLVKIGQGATTRLHKPQFEGIKDLLAVQNDLPDFLRNAASAETEFPDISQGSWPSVACTENKRFVDETHLRLNLIDYLLEELKDKDTPLLKKCRCPSGGRSDYFVSVGGNWIPVEAKQNIMAERNILGQVAKYTGQRWFRPTQSVHKDETFGKTSGTCLIVDESGIYIISGGRFFNCSPGNPVWRREDMGHELIPEIRDLILKGHEV